MRPIVSTGNLSFASICRAFVDQRAEIECVKIDIAEKFPHLSKAPVVEAVIDFRALASEPWNHERNKTELQQLLPAYPTIRPQREFQHEFTATPPQPPHQRTVDLGWSGLLLESQDKLHVAQFQRTGFAFSRLGLYPDWDQFVTETLRLWEIHCQITHPIEVSRIGVRFINRMAFPAEEFSLVRYIHRPAQPPPDLPFPMLNFVHQERYTVTGADYPYLVNVIKTMQPVEGGPPKVPVILDIDAFIQQPIPLSKKTLTSHLANLHWIKNKLFFTALTQEAIDFFR
jgi:uncharacterized protein (TIGR04255 family)